MQEIPEDVWKILIALLGGALGGGALGFRIGKKQSVIGSGTAVDQAGAKAGGDIVGGNKTSN